MKNHWEHFRHEADMGIRGYGSTLGEAFTQGALALTNIITDHHRIRPLKKLIIKCDAPDYELLFADWLNAIIYKMDTLDMLFSKFVVKITDYKLEAEIKGEKIDYQRHQPVVDVKGATYAELKVFSQGEQWIAQCVIDV